MCFYQTGPHATFTKQLAAGIMIFIVHLLVSDKVEIQIKKRHGLEFGWKVVLSINTDFKIQIHKLLIPFNSIWILYYIDSFEIYKVNFSQKLLKLCCKLYREPWYIDSFHKLLIWFNSDVIFIQFNTLFWQYFRYVMSKKIS